MPISTPSTRKKNAIANPLVLTVFGPRSDSKGMRIQTMSYTTTHAVSIVNIVPISIFRDNLRKYETP